MSERRSRDDFDFDHPCGYRVLIELDSLKDKKLSKGGIIIATEKSYAREAQGTDTGTVLGWGPLAFSSYGGPEKYGIKEGDKVSFHRYEGLYYPPFEDDPEDHAGYRTLDEEHIAMVHKPKKGDKE